MFQSIKECIQSYYILTPLASSNITGNWNYFLIVIMDQNNPNRSSASRSAVNHFILPNQMFHTSPDSAPPQVNKLVTKVVEG